MRTAQISAHLSKDTKGLVDAYTKKSGVKKDFLIEDALLHHLQALREIPQDIMIPTRITLSMLEMERLTDLLKNPPKANTTLLALMANDSVRF